MLHNISRYLLTLVALFAMTTGAWAQDDEWINVVSNSDMEGTDVSCFYVKEKGSENMYLAHITEGIGVEGSRAIKVQSSDNELNNWDTQFFVRLPYELPAGTQYRLSFDYKADKDGNADLQCAHEPGQYVFYNIHDIKLVCSFTTSWGHFEGTYIVPDACDGSKSDQGDWLNIFQTIYLSLSLNKVATEFIIDNMKVELQKSVLAGLTPKPVTDQKFMMPYVTFNSENNVASFDMPASDVTVDYELARDMAVDVTAEIAERIRIQKDATTSAYEAVTPAEIIPVVTDVLDNGSFVMTENTHYTAVLQKLSDNDTWADVTDLSVGTFRFTITGAGLYDGTIYTNEFALFEGYEVVIPGGEYITYFKDEPLRVDADKTDARFYTVSSVDGTTATLSGPFDAMPASTPMLVFNSGSAPATVLLIPCADPDLELTVYSGFTGTLTATTIAASDATTDRYAFNGKQFVWVKNALSVGANKAWLEVPTSAATARAINLVFGDATGIDATVNGQWSMVNGEFYDLNGRKLNGIPTKKGVYIMNGKKVVIK